MATVGVKGLIYLSHYLLAFIPGDIVDHESARGTAIVAARHCTETLLARGVPDLKLYLLTAYFDNSDTLKIKTF